MKKTFRNLFILFIFLGLVFVSFNNKGSEVVSAATPPTITSLSGAGDDLVKVVATQGTYPIAYYLVGGSTSSALKFESSATTTTVSMMNGTYFVWAVDTQGNMSTPGSYTMKTSCEPNGVINATGGGSIDMCAFVDKNYNITYLTGTSVVTCATGYYVNSVQTGKVSDTCRQGKITLPNNMSKRFCKVTYEYLCQKSSGGVSNTTVSSLLSSLSLSEGSLTPTFSSNYLSYATTINASKVTINATLKDGNASFVDGFGPRSVSLGYGSNVFYIKVKGSQETVYKITITRPGSGYSSTNTLSSLSVSTGSISPSFNSNTNDYTVYVGSDVGSIDVNASLKDSKSSFVDGYGPRTKTLVYGENKVQIKVKSQSGSVRVYTVIVNRDQPSEVTEPVVTPVPGNGNSSALLKSIILDNGSLEFEQNTFDYNVTVDNSVTNIVTTVEAENESDNVVITGGSDLVVGGNEITVVVSSSDGSVTNTYTLFVTRKEEETVISSNSLLSDLIIEGHKIKFDAKNTEYSFALNKDESSLNITASPSDDKSSITIEGNDKLTTGSEVKIRVTAESGDYTDYFLKITGYKKSGNIFLTIFIVLIIIIVVAYIVLRILGYKIVFNFTAIKNFFSNLMHKN